MTMRVIALALACLACTAHGRKVQQIQSDGPDSKSQLASLLMASSEPSAAFQGAAANRPIQQARAQSPTMQDGGFSLLPKGFTPKMLIPGMNGVPRKYSPEQDAARRKRLENLVLIDENFQFMEAEIPDFTPTFRVLAKVQELKVLSKLSELGILSKLEEQGAFTKLEESGLLSEAELYLPIIDELGLLFVLQDLLDNRINIVPASAALASLGPLYIFGLVSGSLPEGIPTVLAGILCVLGTAAGAAGLAVNGFIKSIQDGDER